MSGDAISPSGELDVRAVMREVPVISDLTSAIDVIQALRKSPHMVLVYDEYGPFRRRHYFGRYSRRITGVFQESDAE
jgi:putative hemolysin